MSLFKVLLLTAPLLSFSAAEKWRNETYSFKHPGVFLSQSNLDFIKERVADGDQPWTLAYADMTGETLSALSRKPTPFEKVECGAFSRPDIGCAPERSDAAASYLNALRWVIEDKQEYADKAIQYLDAWSSKLTAHTDVNADLQAAWAASVWTRAAEIIRYTDAGWSDEGIARFEKLLRDVYLPRVATSTTKGMNWELVLIESTIHIGVFLNDAAVFNSGLDRLTAWAPAFIYLTSDGPTPIPPPFLRNSTSSGNSSALFTYWGGLNTFQADGVTSETCQEFKRVGYGITAISHALETAYIQGVDLWSRSDIGKRVQVAADFNIEQADAASVPAWLCGGKVDNTDIGASTEVVLHARHDRLGAQMWKTESHTNRNRPAGANYLNLAWETLTNAGYPAE